MDMNKIVHSAVTGKKLNKSIIDSSIAVSDLFIG